MQLVVDSLLSFSKEKGKKGENQNFKVRHFQVMLRSLRRTLAMVPYVIEHNPRGMDRVYDIWSRLLKERIVCVMGPVSCVPTDCSCSRTVPLPRPWLSRH